MTPSCHNMSNKSYERCIPYEKWWFSPYGWWFRKPANGVEVCSFSRYLQDIYKVLHLKWLFGISEPSTVTPGKARLVSLVAIGGQRSERRSRGSREGVLKQMRGNTVPWSHGWVPEVSWNNSQHLFVLRWFFFFLHHHFAPPCGRIVLELFPRIFCKSKHVVNIGLLELLPYTINVMRYIYI